jgi:hypothetical protein
MGLVQMKTIQGLFWAKGQRPLIVLMCVKAGMPLKHQLTDPLHKVQLGLLLESLHNCSPDIFIQPESMALSHFLKGAKPWLTLQDVMSKVFQE